MYQSWLEPEDDLQANEKNKEVVSLREETLKQREQCLAHKCEKEWEKNF